MAILTALVIFSTPCAPPAGVQVVEKTVPLTAYFVPSESNWTSTYRFWKAVQMNGTGVLDDGTFVVVHGNGFREVQWPQGRWGRVVPFKTAAANPELFAAGTTVCFPELNGFTVTVTDTGGGLTKDGPLDIFVGTRQGYKNWQSTWPDEAVTISWKE